MKTVTLLRIRTVAFGIVGLMRITLRRTMNCRSIVPGYYGRHSKDRVLRCSGRIIVLSPDRQWDSDPNRPRMYVCTMHRNEAADAGLDIQRSIMKVKARKLTMLILSWRHWNIVSYQESERKESEKAQTLKARGQLDKSHNLQVTSETLPFDCNCQQDSPWMHERRGPSDSQIFINIPG